MYTVVLEPELIRDRQNELALAQAASPVNQRPTPAARVW